MESFAESGHCEFVADFALPLPGIFIAEQLGLDRSEYLTFRRWADAMLAQANRRLTVEEAIARPSWNSRLSISSPRSSRSAGPAPTAT